MIVAVRLADEVLWNRFDRLQNEMIITRSGRCLFPLLRLEFIPVVPGDAGFGGCSMLDLGPGREYSIGVSIQPVDGMRWKFKGDQWLPIMAADQRVPSSSSSSTLSSSQSHGGTSDAKHVYTPHRAMLTEDLILHGLSFARLKLNNDLVDEPASPNFSLQSFHKYIPVFYVSDLVGVTQTLRFPQTTFIAVTHYQNRQVTELKKSHNPHAKGFLTKSPYFAGDDGDDGSEDDTSDSDISVSHADILATKTLLELSSPSQRHNK